MFLMGAAARKIAASGVVAAGLAMPAAADCNFGVTFAFGSSALSSEAEAVISEINLRFPNANKRIEGHTDAVGTELFNEALSDARANAVANYLRSLGETDTVLVTTGLGETQLLISTAAREERNRRANIVVEGVDCEAFADDFNVAFGALPALALLGFLLGGGGGTTTTTTTTGTTGTN